MTSFNLGSPVRSILEQGETLGLTPDQRRSLQLVDIDYQSEAARLLSERQRLELDAVRKQVETGSKSHLTIEILSAMDGITVQLRKNWFRASETARQMLSAEQLANSHQKVELPNFDYGLSEPSFIAIDERIAAVLSARVKDTKVIEVETAQAIAERLLGWAKSAAVVTGIPLALLAVALAVMGISNWVDFKNRLEEGKKEVGQQLEAAKQGAKEFSGQVETAKQNAKEFGSQAAALEAQFNDLKKRYGDVSSLANDVRGLSDKVQHLERIRFKESSALRPGTKDKLEQQIKDYRAYLQSIGYHRPTTDLDVFVDPAESANAYYDGKTMVISPKLVDNSQAIYEPYTQRMLKETKAEAWEASGWKITAIIQGLSDYFTCSYEGDPKFGAKYVETFRDILPPEMVQRGYLRNLANKRLFVQDSANAFEKGAARSGRSMGWRVLGYSRNSRLQRRSRQMRSR
jgi:uncharacterized protein YoxC